MDIRKICPVAVSGLLSRVSRTQPVPSIAACFAGSARTAKIASAGALTTVVALTLSSAIWLPPHKLSLSRFRRSPSPELIAGVATARTAVFLPVALRACRLRTAGISLAMEIYPKRRL
jgi:hypothetical protein